jgi:hypothetical protein
MGENWSFDSGWGSVNTLKELLGSILFQVLLYSFSNYSESQNRSYVMNVEIIGRLNT